jgi:hypothetical protein
LNEYNVLDLDVYMDVLYMYFVCNVQVYNSSCVGYIYSLKKIYSTCLSTTTGKTVVNKEANLLQPPSHSKLAWRGDERLTYYNLGRSKLDGRGGLTYYSPTKL